MNLAIWIVAGAVLGVMTSLAGRVRQRSGIVLYVSVGVLGALFGGLLIAPLVGELPADPHAFSLPCFIVALVASAISLGTTRAFRNRRRGWSVPKNSGF
jgi:uncharacterized membrane protein YeaQ/YmgE (transglycosylase-associated protein family)